MTLETTALPTPTDLASAAAHDASDASAFWTSGLLGTRAAQAAALAPEAAAALGTGIHALGDAGARAHLLVVPEHTAGTPLPLVVLLHGAASDPAHVLPVLEREAEARGIVLLVPKSTGLTWDAVRNGFGPDVELLDDLLPQVFAAVPIDQDRITIAGFSDGATAALSLGLANGELFTRVIAFSPGFVVGSERNGEPAIFVSHGTADSVLPIDRTSRRIVPALERVGYEPEYHEFDGYHEVPAHIAALAADRI